MNADKLVSHLNAKTKIYRRIIKARKRSRLLYSNRLLSTLVRVEL